MLWHKIADKELPSNQSQFIEQAKFNYSSLRKSSEKETKAIEDAAIRRLGTVLKNK